MQDRPEEILASCYALLDELLRECMAFIGEHFEPGDETEGTMSDSEHVGRLAVRHVLGPADFLERAADTYDVADLVKVARTLRARHAIHLIATDSLQRLADEERLYGKPLSQEQDFHGHERYAVTVLTHPQLRADGCAHDTVMNYLWNVRGGLEHSMSAFYHYGAWS